MANERLSEHAARLIGKPLDALAPLARGGNSDVFRAQCADGTSYLVKRYVAKTADGRDRLDVEFSALTLLADHGMAEVPRAIACDWEHDIAVYEYIDGMPACSTSLVSTDIDAAVRFLCRLDEVRERISYDAACPAAEACFAFEDVAGRIAHRFVTLFEVPAADARTSELQFFLTAHLAPVYARILPWAAQRLDALGLSMSSRLPQDEWVLSPSDFGFHNAIRKRDGALVFVDFEYFGWDDPAKMISDFLLHPSMTLTGEDRTRSVTGLCRGLSRRPLLEKRLAVAYPLCAVKWCLILLNGFVPGAPAVRRFADDAQARDAFLAGQLEKSRRMLDHAARGMKEFPYCARD